MSTNVLLPQWGMNMEDGLLVSWLVKEGDAVEAGQPLVEVETAKIESELESPISGVVTHIMSPEGTTVDVGTIVAVIGEARRASRSAATWKAPPPGRGASAARPGPVRAGDAGGSQAGRPARIRPGPGAEGTGPNGRIPEEDVRQAVEAGSTGPRTAIQVVPRARQLAKEHGIELGRVDGTGPNRSILVADVERAMSAHSHSPQPKCSR